jgi:hypothetical protein
MEKKGAKIRRGQSNKGEGGEKIDFESDDVQFPSEDTSSAELGHKSHGTDESENIRLTLCLFPEACIHPLTWPVVLLMYDDDEASIRSWLLPPTEELRTARALSTR